MKPFHFILFLVFTIFFFQNQSIAQETSINKKGRIRLSDGRAINFKKLVLKDNKISYTDPKTLNKLELDKARVIDIQSIQGNHAIEYGLGCAGGALVGSILGIVRASVQNLDTSGAAGIVAGLTLTGGLIGVLIGINKPKYKTAWENPNFDFSAISIETSNPNNVSSIGIHYSF